MDGGQRTPRSCRFEKVIYSTFHKQKLLMQIKSFCLNIKTDNKT